MTTDVTALGLKLVRSSDTVEIDLRPLQGLWTEEQYLRLSNQANLLIEFTDGRIELLAMPTSRHQEILLWLYGRLKAVLGVTGGRVLVAPLRLRIPPRQVQGAGHCGVAACGRCPIPGRLLARGRFGDGGREPRPAGT